VTLEFAFAIIRKRLHEFFARVHDERTAPGDGFAQRTRGQQQRAGALGAAGQQGGLARAQRNEAQSFQFFGARRGRDRRLAFIKDEKGFVIGRQRLDENAARRNFDIEIDRIDMRRAPARRRRRCLSRQ